MYGLSFGGDEASIVVKTSDKEKAEQVFKRHDIKTLDSDAFMDN
jgi:hypothetical protein